MFLYHIWESLGQKTSNVICNAMRQFRIFLCSIHFILQIESQTFDLQKSL